MSYSLEESDSSEVESSKRDCHFFLSSAQASFSQGSDSTLTVDLAQLPKCQFINDYESYNGPNSLYKQAI
jgi:hypothetical protein